MKNIRFDYKRALPFVSQHEIDYMSDYVAAAHKMLHEKSGAGNDFLGWVDLPVDYDKEEFARIKAAAKKIRSDSDALIVIGIGGPAKADAHRCPAHVCRRQTQDIRTVK